MSTHLTDAAALANGPVVTDPAACELISELLHWSAELLQYIAQHHAEVSQRALLKAASVQVEVTL